MIVLKFGGTSMANAATWRKIFAILNQKNAPVVVVSATSGTTNNLYKAARMALEGNLEAAKQLAEDIRNRHYEIADELLEGTQTTPDEAYEIIDFLVDELEQYLSGVFTLRELTPRSLDRIASIGERLSSRLMAYCGKNAGLDMKWLDSAEIVLTDDTYGRALPKTAELKTRAAKLGHICNEGKIPILGGFYGSNDAGQITTLGRGGSDYSAALIGSAIRAEAIEIWTDVSGMFTCDPRFIPEARPVRQITFDEAAELAYFGAKVLHPSTIQPAIDQNIPVWIKNTFDPDHPGTCISDTEESQPFVTAIAFKRDISLITIESSRMLMAYGFIARVFDIFEELKIPVDVVTTSEVSISISVDVKDGLTPVLNRLKVLGQVSVSHDLALLCLVGRKFLSTPGIAADVFEALRHINIRMISQGSSENNLTMIVQDDEVLEGAGRLHNLFFED